MKIKKIASIAVATLLVVMLTTKLFTRNTYADGVFQVSPMNQRISLVPGERYYGTFKVTNPGTSIYNFHYKTSVGPFYVDDDFGIKYENNGDYNQIVDWITIENPSGVIAPNDTVIIKFYIDTPLDAPAGGQYALIKVEADNNNSSEGDLNIQQTFSIAHILYSEVAGETTHGGEFNNIHVPGFLLSGNIYGTSTIKNTGNVHSDGIYTLQIYPLFSKEEVFTNEENPDTANILPGVSRTNVIEWKETPSVGIFHVFYKASFEGIENKVDKMVIVCPLWLLFIIILAIFLIIFKIWSGKKREKK